MGENSYIVEFFYKIHSVGLQLEHGCYFSSLQRERGAVKESHTPHKLAWLLTVCYINAVVVVDGLPQCVATSFYLPDFLTISLCSCTSSSLALYW